MTTKRDYEEAFERECQHWPGTRVEFSQGGKHQKAKFWFQGPTAEYMLALTYPGTPSDAARGIHNALAQARRTLKALGAKRDAPEPSAEEDEAPYRKPNNGAAERPHPVAGEQAKPQPDVIDQLVGAGIAKQDAADVARAEKVLAGKPQPEAPVRQPINIAEAVEVSDEPSERLVKHLRDCGFDISIVGPVSRAGVIMAAVDMIEDGIYFGLPMEVYRNVPRLGATDLQRLNKSAGDFWAGSWLDPDRKDEADEEQKKWKVVGSAYHCARLEPDQFEARYCRQPCKADFADQAAEHGACWNGTEIGTMLGSMGHTKKRAEESVGEQGSRLEDAGFEGVIWPLIDARFQASKGDKIALEARVWDEIVRDMERLKGSADIHGMFTDAGASEVSVFWTDDNNIQRKARFDRLELDRWLDFKTFDNSRDKRLEQAIIDAVRFNRYYLTAASYFDAAEAVRVGGLQIRGEATDIERELIARLQIKPEHLECVFVFQQKSGIPNLLARTFRFFDVPDSIENSWDTGADEEAQARGHDATRRPTQIYAKGKAEIDYAKRLFAMYAQVYLPGEPWAPLEPMGSISDADFSPNWLEGRYE